MATMTSCLGVMTGAFLVAILSQKLLLSRWEKYIYNFVLKVELAKAQKYHAANIIQYGWKSWRLTGMGMQQSIEYVNTQRKLFEEVSTMQQIKQGQRALANNVIGLAELMIAH
ncbi:unnamed protein product, partial [Rotaria sp. Silwood2]